MLKFAGTLSARAAFRHSIAIVAGSQLDPPDGWYDVADSRIGEARADLEAIEKKFSLKGCRINASSIDERRWNITSPDGRKVGFFAHLNKRRKALRDWLRKWGKQLRSMGYQVRMHDAAPSEPKFVIEEVQPEDGFTAQLENEKSKRFFDPKRARSKRLGKPLDE